MEQSSVRCVTFRCALHITYYRDSIDSIWLIVYLSSSMLYRYRIEIMGNQFVSAGFLNKFE